MRKFTFLTVCFLPLFLLGQSFSDVADEQGIFHQYMGGEYGGGASFYDANGDGWDDLTICNDGTDIVLYLNMQGTFEGPFSVASNTGQAKSVTWVDYDNDGDADLFVTRYDGPWTLLRNDGDVLNLTDVTEESGLPITSYFTYGASWSDIDRDGDLDLYICNYHGDGVTNFLYRNNGDGTFTDISIESGTDDGSWWSFQGLFTDYNHDLWPDLFVVNDRLPASNHMYRNDGGVFSDVTEQLGLVDYFFSMNASTADFDHDGDLDLYVSNNPSGNRMYVQNEDLSYSNQASSTGVAVLDHSWSAQWIDYNNDTFEDLHVCCSPFWGQPGQNRFFHNNGNGTFSLNIFNGGFGGDQGWSHTSVAGDFNNDGFFDLFVVNDYPDVSRLWQCAPNSNNYLKVKLEGVISNRDGIGTWIHVWSDGVEQMRYTYCGEGYLTQNSGAEIFGMALASKADSLTLFWPSGQVDTYYDLNTNNTYQFIEGASMVGGIEASQMELCQGDSLLLTALDGVNHVWSTGEEGLNAIWVHEPGIYSYTAESDLGIPFSSEQLIIAPGNLPNASFAIGAPTCDGTEDGSITITPSNPSSNYLIDINGNASSWVTAGLPAGEYHIVLTDPMGCISDTTIQIEATPGINASWELTSILCNGGSATASLHLSGGSGELNADWGSVNPSFLPAGEHTFTVTDANNCQQDFTFSLSEPDALEALTEVSHEVFGGDGSIQLTIVGGTGPYNVQWTGPNGFSSSDHNLSDLQAGIYTAMVTDSNGCVSIVSEVLLPVSIHELEGANWRVYPNPASDFVTVQMDSRSLYDVVLWDASGRQVATETGIFGSQGTQIAINHLAAGYYLIELRNNGARSLKPLIIQR